MDSPRDSYENDRSISAFHPYFEREYRFFRRQHDTLFDMNNNEQVAAPSIHYWIEKIMNKRRRKALLENIIKEAEYYPIMPDYRYNIMMDKIFNHNVNVPVEEFMSLNTGICFQVDKGITGYIRLCSELRQAKVACLNNAICDRYALNELTDFELFLGHPLKKNADILIKGGTVFATIIFDRPVTIMESFINAGPEKLHSVKILRA